MVRIDATEIKNEQTRVLTGLHAGSTTINMGHNSYHKKVDICTRGPSIFQPGASCALHPTLLLRVILGKQTSKIMNTAQTHMTTITCAKNRPPLNIVPGPGSVRNGIHISCIGGGTIYQTTLDDVIRDVEP